MTLRTFTEPADLFDNQSIVSCRGSRRFSDYVQRADRDTVPQGTSLWVRLRLCAFVALQKRKETF